MCILFFSSSSQSHTIKKVITTEKSNILLRHFEKKNEQKLDLGSVKPNAIKRSAAEALQQETLDNGVNSSLYSELSPKPKNRRLAQQQASNSTVEIALTSAGSSGASDDTQPTGRQHAPAKASSSKM